MNFGIGSAFSKGSETDFSESPGKGPGPFYKLCLMKILKMDITIKSFGHPVFQYFSKSTFSLKLSTLLNNFVSSQWLIFHRIKARWKI